MFNIVEDNLTVQTSYSIYYYILVFCQLKAAKTEMKREKKEGNE